MYMDKDLIVIKIYKLVNQLNDSELLDSIHPFYDRNKRTCKILFVSSFFL